MKELIKYQVRIYFKSSKIIMPLLLWLIFLRISYSQKPLEYNPNIVMSAGVLFFIMTWIGYSYMDLEDSISEQIIILKIQNMNLYHCSKMMFLILIGAIMALIGIAFPVLQNIAIGETLFKRDIIFCDIIGGVLLHCITAFNGAVVGALFHPRIIRNRKIAVLLALSVALIGYTTGVVEKNIPITRFFTWIFPPVYKILESFNGYEYFSVRNMVFPILYGSIYSVIVILIQISLLKKIKF